MIRICLFLLCTFNLATVFVAPAQTDVGLGNIKGIGLPFIKHYIPSDYQFDNQNFDVLIGDDSKIYFANGSGVLVFDGSQWTTLPLPNGDPVYSLTKAYDGTIYVGGVNEIGYLKSSSNGTLEYVSLISELRKKYNDGFISWNNFTAGDEIIFSTLSKLFIFNHDKRNLNVVDCPGAWAGMMVNDNQIYSYQGDSLYVLANNLWKPIRSSNLLVPTLDYRIVLVEVSKSQTIAINHSGFYDFETEQPIAIHDDIRNFLNKSVIIGAKLLFGQYIAITTWSGLLITDLNGNPVQFLNKQRGLPEEFLYHMEVDNNDGLWVASLNGVLRIDISSPYTIMNQNMNVEGLITDSRRFDDELIISTFSGAFKTNWNNLLNPFATPKFEMITPLPVHGFIEEENEMILLTEWAKNLVLTKNGISTIDSTFGKLFSAGFITQNQKNLILGSLDDGYMIHFKKELNKWDFENLVNLDLLQIQYLVEGDDNIIWASSIAQGLYKIKYDLDNAELISQELQTKKDGLSAVKNIAIKSIDNEPLFIIRSEVYRYDSETKLFSIDERFPNSEENHLQAIDHDSKGNIYYITDKFNILRKTTTGYLHTSLPNIDLIEFPPNNLSAFDEQNIIISSNNAIIHLDPSRQQTREDFEVSFTNMTSLNSDTVYFGGFGPLPARLDFPSNENALRIEFSSNNYNHSDQIKYKWKLNAEKSWSSWSIENHKDYTNLSHGDYLFEVIGKNLNGIESPITSLKFTIATPWYFTWWAYVGYFFALFLFIWIVVKIYSGKLIADRNRLEQIVRDRTEEISEQRNQLIQMDEMKDKFFLNISHELRTPLTLTMGNVEQMLKGKLGPINDQQNESLQTSFRNSQRLLKMVNNILDISKLEGGKIQLKASNTKPAEILSKVIGFFSSKFFDKNLTLKQEIVSDISLYLDKDKFETIFINLIANAFKFTPDGGFIEVKIIDQNDEVVFIVKDNGIGIPEENLPFVFDRFYQSPHGLSDEGTGLGLALSKELVDLHGASISVHSAKNVGTTFTLTFKKGKAHLHPSQITENVPEEDLRTMENKYPLTDHLRKTSETSILSPEPNQNTPHILLVEDNPEMSKYIISLLSGDYQISLAKNGQEGLDFLKSQKPDLILTDWLMPVMDGYEMATEIKKSEELAFIPMIFLTARAREQDKINVLNMGIDDYLFKPFSAEELQIRIKNLLKNKIERTEFLIEESINPSEIEWKEFQSKLKQDIDDYINEHIKEEITGEALADHVNQSKRSVYRKIKANTGLSVMEYIKEFRLRKARNILEAKEFQTVSEVSYQVGFNYPSHFTRNYKERFGKNPSEYLE